MKRQTGIDALMNEPIRMIGFPQIIVTRGWCYCFLRDCGWDTTGSDQSRRGPRFDTADYAAFGHATVDLPLTDDETRDYYLEQIKDTYLREAVTL